MFSFLLKKIYDVWPIVAAIFILGASVKATMIQIEQVEARGKANSRVIMSVKDDLTLIRESQIRTEENIKFINRLMEEKKHGTF